METFHEQSGGQGRPQKARIQQSGALTYFH
jgi:hypothetical protein